jgi:organic radical activating enzyme
MSKLNKEAYEVMAGKDWPSYEEYINGVEISDQVISAEITELEENAPKINLGYDYMSLVPLYGDFNAMTPTQQHRLTESKTFCMLPWVHMHAFPDGRAYPCCLSEYWKPIGDLRKNTMAELWNSEPYKKMRVNMMQDLPCVECEKCYERERHGAFTMRNDANRNYGHHVADVEKTEIDGTHPDFKIRYWDVRFSNLCNMRCRSCGPIFSSNWYNDHVKLYNVKPDVLGRPMERVEYITGTEDGMLEQMEEHIPHLEQVYFAGGEPLIMKEHYYLLEKLIEYGKTDVRIQYNTNFSELRFKDKHVFEYWKHFKNISVGASLDASGERAELMRKGTEWKQTIENRERMMKEVPHVDFYVSSTISSMNVLHVLDFHREWANLGLINAKDWNVNICQSPDWYRADIFPNWFKAGFVTPAYEQHIEWLEPQDPLKRATNGFKSMLSFINNNDGTQHWDRFIKETADLDRVRDEDFWNVFPEYGSLK